MSGHYRRIIFMARRRQVSRISSAEVVDLWLVACYVEIVYAFWLGYKRYSYAYGRPGQKSPEFRARALRIRYPFVWQPKPTLAGVR
jgi:hypothetical protein